MGLTSRSSPCLTPREREIFQLLAQGMTTRQIADELFLSLYTVRTHTRNGVIRLEANTRLHALSMAIRSGEIEP
jgi:DNA-binding CsgD family transcriptional regulator